MREKVKYYDERLSKLALTALILGILSFILLPFQQLNIFILVVAILLGIGAIVTGLLAMKRTTLLPLRGRNLAYAGLVLGANGLFWLMVNMIYRFIF